MSPHPAPTPAPEPQTYRSQAQSHCRYRGPRAVLGPQWKCADQEPANTNGSQPVTSGTEALMEVSGVGGPEPKKIFLSFFLFFEQK